MYLHFLWNYGKVQKDEGVKERSSSELCVDVDGDKGGQTEGNAAQYRVGCIVLSVICFVLLLAVIVLSVGGRREVAAVENNISSAVTYSLEQCQTLVSPTTVCPDTERAPEDRTSPSATTCSLEQCQDHLTKTQPVLCPEMEETTADSRTCPPTETCTVEQCQAHVTSAPCGTCRTTRRDVQVKYIWKSWKFLWKYQSVNPVSSAGMQQYHYEYHHKANTS
ncbi:uncharacterized protein LOC103387814 isoform X2 [Cynoglossus semilaevis]|uniref:uncharacterized protein LOC103387814 isoform X2 n=1 Tax=Cynoglossus semilaevis TaxID=244447 RepID=UPI0004986B98|nr:uncharacterized protein LOC103387814 isoform X2 [Cynoglossus semilaevis]